MQHMLGDTGTAVDVMVAVHEHLGFHDGHHAHFLAYGCIAGQHLGVGMPAHLRRVVMGDRIDLTPLGKTCALFLVAFQPVGQAVQSVGDQVAGSAGQGTLALVHLDTGNDLLGPGDFRQGNLIVILLCQSLLEQDDTGDVFSEIRCIQQQRPVSAPVFFSSLDVDAGEALGNRWQAFVRGQNTAVIVYHVGDGLL